MAPPAAAAKHTRVLLPFTSDSLRIPDELAAEIGAEEAIVVGPTGGKARPWPVEVGRDGDGAFLGRGWREFAAACGVAPGWRLVLRHRGRGVLTIKVFDDECCCLRDLGEQPPPAAAEAGTSSQDTARKPQFLRVFPKDFMENMLIPVKFVQQHIPKDHLDNHMAIISGPLGKVSPIELEINRSEVFFRGGWSQFLVFHDIAEANALLLRYEGNMVFTVKVFEPDGCQREAKHKDIRIRQISTLPHIEERQEEPPVSIQKHCKNYWPSSDGKKKQNSHMTYLNKAPLWKKSIYEIGPPSWIKKEINMNSLKKELALPGGFCCAIGLLGRCTMTLKTSMTSTKSWQVLVHPWKKGNYWLGKGWLTFCRENSLKLGDICTFNVIKTTLWHVVVTRCKEVINQPFYQESPSVSSRIRMSKNKWSRSKRNKGSIGSMSSFNKAAFPRKSFYEIGPPSWIKKVINAHTLEKNLALATAFCDAIGLQESCMITLKTSMDSTISWKVRGIPIKNSCSYLLIKGWRRFCQENYLKEGDICTFNIVETTLWHVVITRCKEKIDQLCHGNHSAFSMKRKRENDRSSSEEQKRPKGSMTSWHKASSKTGSVFKFGPPAWIMKEINAYAINNNILYLPPVFCEAIGIREPCLITLKTSMSSSASWQAHITPYNNSSHRVKGLNRFYQDNGIKVGDLCTFKIVETTLWHVVIEPQ
ncbi:unnamed protein product [Urochloa decumbens]|uniref:TF-B3 domain-containing protein n=1 Tax=Urochloa decumbens TaxID=240449 RepID=A0ABC9CAM4_9POAL